MVTLAQCIPHRGKMDRERLGDGSVVKLTETTYIMVLFFTFPSLCQVNTSGQSLMHEMAAVSAVATFRGSSRGMAWFISLCTEQRSRWWKLQSVETPCQQRWDKLTQEQTGSFSHQTDEIKSQPTLGLTIGWRQRWQNSLKNSDAAYESFHTWMKYFSPSLCWS